jgi:hypothetical protein
MYFGFKFAKIFEKEHESAEPEIALIEFSVQGRVKVFYPHSFGGFYLHNIHFCEIVPL